MIQSKKSKLRHDVVVACWVLNHLGQTGDVYFDKDGHRALIVYGDPPKGFAITSSGKIGDATSLVSAILEKGK